MKLYSVQFLFIIYGLSEAAFVNINAPKSVVKSGGNIAFEVTNISPNASSQDFDRLDCAIMRPGESSYKIIVAQYDKHSSRFKTPSQGIPKDFRERVSYVGSWSFVIHQIQLKDKSLKVVCLLNYKNGSMTSHVESPVYEVTEIYEQLKPAFVDISTPNFAVELGANILFKIKSTSPGVSSQRFERLDCGIMRPSNPSHTTIIAQYAKHSSRFIAPTHGIPKDFRSRVSYVGNWSFVINGIRYEDKSLKVVCLMSYKNGSMTSHIKSPVYEVKEIYVNPAFYKGSTPEGTVTIKQGQKATIRCVAKSWPESKIHWESKITKRNTNSVTSINKHKREVIETSTFTLDSPTSNDDGKIVDCVVKPKHGKGLRRRFTLSYVDDGKKPNDKEDHGEKDKNYFMKNLKWIIPVICVVGIIILAISIGCCVANCC